MTSEDSSRHLLTLTQAAQFLNVSKWTLRRLVDAGTVAVVQLPSRRKSVRGVFCSIRTIW